MKKRINIHLIAFEDRESWIKGSSGFPKLFREAYEWMEEIEAGFEKEFSEFLDTKFFEYDAENEEEIMNKMKAEDGFNIYVCGSHFISYPALMKVLEKEKMDKSKISFLQFDFHPDLRNIYEGRKLSHATMAKRIAEENISIMQIGIGEQSIEDLYNAEKHKVIQYFELPAFEEVEEKLKEKIYLSLDVDAFTFFSKVSTPSLSKIDERVFAFLEKLFMKKEIIGMDIVELLADKAEAMKAAQFIRKLLFYRYGKN